MTIPLYSPTIRRSEMDAVLTCLVDERVGPGEVSVNFEKKICEVFNVQVACALRSPAIALSYALKLLNLPENSKVMVSALAPHWQYIEIIRSKLEPLVLDVDPKTALISPLIVKNAIDAGGAVLILNETLGGIPNLEQILSHEIPIIEDISQSAGAEVTIDGVSTMVGNFGTYSILGMEERDIMTSGGGAVLMASDKANALPLKRFFTNAPETDKMPDINAALALVQLKNMKKNMEMRQQYEEVYARALMETKHSGFAKNENATNPVYYFPVLLSRGFNEVEKYTNKKQIEIQQAFANSIIAKLEGKLDNCPSASSLAMRTVLFPLYPLLGANKANTIARVIGTLP